MLKNKAPQEQPANPVERDREETQWLMERLRKIGFNSNQPFAVFKVVARKVARKGTQEAVFVMPGYSEGNIKRYLAFLGWDAVAIIEYTSITDALKDTSDPTMLKTKGIVGVPRSSFFSN